MKTFSTVLFSVLICFCIIQNIYSQSIENEFLVIRGDTQTGRIFIGTKKGNPEIPGDDNRNIISDTFKSFLTVMVDDKPYVINADSQFPVKMTVQGDVLTNTVELPMKIRVTQIVKLVNSSITGRKDTVQIAFIIKNTGEMAHHVSIRYVLDTDMDAYMKSGFMLIDGKKINSETVFIENVPSKIYILENAEKVTESQLNLFLRFSESENLPYRLAICGYNKFTSASFEFKPKINASFAAGTENRDAALGVYYRLGRLLPSQERKINISLGIHPRPVPQVTDFNYSIDLPRSVKKPPLTVRFSIKNTGTQILKIVKVELLYPDFLRFDGEINVIQAATEIKPQESRNFLWKFVYRADLYKYVRLKFIIKAYNEDLQLTKKEETRDVLLTAGRETEETTVTGISLKLRQLLDELIYSNQIIDLSTQEMTEINFILEKINSASNIESVIAGQRMISVQLFEDLKRQFQMLLYRIEIRKRKLKEIEQRYQAESQRR